MCVFLAITQASFALLFKSIEQFDPVFFKFEFYDEINDHYFKFLYTEFHLVNFCWRLFLQDCSFLKGGILSWLFILFVFGDEI